MAMTTRRTSALPIPQAELDRMRSQLASTYGAQVWEGAGARILVVRVPRPEPDLVTDIEAAVDYLDPADTKDLTAALLVGDVKAHVVPTHPFADLMARRMQFDAEQGRELRKRLAPGSHLTYRAPGDHRKIVRLALRLRSPTVASMDDAELERWSLTLAPDLTAGKLAGIRAVYLVADQDDVRLSADAFIQSVRQTMAEAEQRRAMAQELASKQATSPRPAGAQRPGAPAAAAPQRVAYAPLRSIGDGAIAHESSVHANPMHGQGPISGHSGASAGSQVMAGPGANAADRANLIASNPLAAAVRLRLEENGFDVLVAPPVKHAIDLAAERTEGDVQRVIVRFPERLTTAVAQEILATCRAIDTDLALVVCADADPDGRKRLIATKARWIQPADVGHLNL